jgi:hypothetical protein
MSSRAFGALVVVSILSAAMATTAGGCSDDEMKPAPADAGGAAMADANRSPPPEGDPATPKTCYELCEEAHPTAVPKDEAINSCWETFCDAPCIKELPGDGGISADASEGVTTDGGGACVSPVVTVSESCDECTRSFCCGSWDACFQDPECSALNACYQQCTD